MWEIGQLSAKYESHGNPGAIGFDPGGGWSYGTNQIETKGGTFGFFMEYLKVHYQTLYKTLASCGGYVAALKGDPDFKALWESLAKTDTSEFTYAQHDFIVSQMYGVAIKRLATSKINLASPPRTNTLADVIYSLSVMAGPGSVKPSGAGSCGLIFDALCTLGAIKTVDAVDDAPLIDAIYTQKLKRIDTGREYRTQPQNIVKAVRNRIVNEHLDAVAELAAERAPKTS